MSSVALCACLIVLAACSDDGGSSGPSATTLVEQATVVTMAGANTRPAPEPTMAGSSSTPTAVTTAVPTTAVPTTPTTPVAVLDATTFVLRRDGIGPLRFGASMTDTMAAAIGVVGPATAVGPTAHFVLDDDYEVLVNRETFRSFDYAYGRVNCFGNGLCVTFGGETEASLAFVGWEYRGEGRDLHAADGSTLGTRGDKTETLVLQPGGCYSAGYGTVSGGIRVTVRSDGEPFSKLDEDGNLIDQTPAAGDIFITDMSAGELPIELGLDC